jgi:hypothetical protein
MANPDRREAARRPEAVRLTVKLTVTAYKAVTELQQRHLIEEGRALPKWQIIDAAIKQYAEQQGIPAGE